MFIIQIFEIKLQYCCYGPVQTLSVGLVLKPWLSACPVGSLPSPR